MSTATAEPTDFFSAANAARSGARSLWSKFLSVICVGLALLTLVPLFSIVFLVLKNGLPLLSWSVFTELPPAAGMTGGGFGNAVVGTLLMVGIALVLATPFGILSAIYINEYDPYSTTVERGPLRRQAPDGHSLDHLWCVRLRRDRADHRRFLGVGRRLRAGDPHPADDSPDR